MNVIAKIILFQALLVIGVLSVNEETFVCEQEGNFPIDNECHTYVNCYKGKNDKAFTKRTFPCNSGTIFDLEDNQCRQTEFVKKSPCNDYTDNEHHKRQQLTGLRLTNAEEFKCKKEGFHADPNDCQTFYRCVKVWNTLQKYTFSCDNDMAFDPSIKMCNYKSAVEEHLKCKTKENSNESPKSEVEHVENRDKTADNGDNSGKPVPIKNEEPAVTAETNSEATTEEEC